MVLQIHIHCRPSFSKPYLSSFTKPKFTIRSQNPIIETQPNDDDDNKSKQVLPGQGFGSSSSAVKLKPSANPDKKKQKGKNRERASIIRRNPVENSAFSNKLEDVEASKEQSESESAFVLAWLGLGSVILLQGIALAASGFLPEEWDNFLVKYVYPIFTPTVGVFVAGTVSYGVLKYLQNEKLKG